MSSLRLHKFSRIGDKKMILVDVARADAPTESIKVIGGLVRPVWWTKAEGPMPIGIVVASDENSILVLWSRDFSPVVPF